MSPPRFAPALCLLTTLLSTSIGQAFNFQWLDDSAIADFSEQDWDIFGQTLENLLENGQDGSVTEWRNEISGNSGSMEISPSETSSCRLLQITNRSATKLGTNQFQFCKQPNGEWKLEATPKPQAED